MISLVVTLYIGHPLSLRNIEGLLAKCGIDICRETVWHCWNRFGPMFAADVRRQRVRYIRSFTHWRCRLDEMVGRLKGEHVCLWHAVDQSRELLHQDGGQGGSAAIQEKGIKRHGKVEMVVTDGLGSYSGAMRNIGNFERHETTGMLASTLTML
jgi:putative transposase